MSSKLLTPEEVCIKLDIKMSKFRSAVFKKEIPVIRIGRLIRIDQEDLDRWIKSLKENKATK